MKKKVQLPELKDLKLKGKKLRMITAYDYYTAAIVEQTPIELILVGDSLGMVMLGYDSTVPVTLEDIIHHARPVVTGAPSTHVVGDMPFGSFNASPEDAVKNGTRLLKEAGVDSVKLEGGEEVAQIISSLVKAGIPVMGHIGLTPQTATALGGFKVQGKDEQAALKMKRDARAVEEAGAYALVMECVPAGLAAEITSSLSIPTIGIGAGPRCDGQVLVMQDMLGVFQRFTPKFVKRYGELGKEIKTALETYAAEVENQTFPGPEHCF